MLIEELIKEAKRAVAIAAQNRETAERLFNYPRPQISRDTLIKAISTHETARARYDALREPTFARLTDLRGKAMR
jgi:hypothetical protein